jgi:DNA polymerase-3 subunit delta
MPGNGAMKLTFEGLSAQLRERLLPVYLVSGEEPLLVGEAGDAIRARARTLGFTERSVFFIERSSAIWEEVRREAQALSLFAARRIVEIRLPGGKPGSSGAAALMRLFEQAGDELLVLVICERLDRDAQASEWVQAAQRVGGWLPIRPVDRARLPQWLRERFSAAGLSVAEDALALLAERTEGNLLAAQQEVDKLALLLAAGARVTLPDIAAASADSARFDVFQLGEAVRGGDAARALRVLSGLQAEGAEPPFVLWALLRELRVQQSGTPVGTRARAPSFERLVARAARADRVAKGQADRRNPWGELALLAVELTGRRTLPMVRANAR